MRKNKRRVSLILISGLIFSCLPISFSGVLLFSESEDSIEYINGNQEWSENKTIDHLVVINQGATLTIKNGVKLTFDGGGLDIEGNMFVKGTVKNSVTFQRSNYLNYGINVRESGKLVIRNADISGSGFGPCVIQNKSIFKRAFACPVNGGINVSGGWLDVESTNFHENNVPIVISNKNLNRIKVNRSKFINNKNFDVYYLGSSGDQLNFQYNWWGDSSGPEKICYEDDDCYYSKFEGEVNFSHWLRSENFHDPVIIIPGILGSWKWTSNGDWKMDPILGTYDSLYETFEDNGYKEGKDLFAFPYQWRDSNENNAVLLKDKIEEVKQAANWPKVDLVAHSMGGLLARQYIESDNYQNDIDQLVMLGTPNNGSPEDYLTWGGGVLAIEKTDVSGFLLEKVFKQEAKEAGFDNIFNYLHKMPIKSVQELLPVYDYLYDTFHNKLRSYQDNDPYPRNEFLENLNLSENISKLNNVSVINVTGQLDNDQTITKIRVGEEKLDSDSLWAYGFPENFDSLFGDHGLEYGKGDGTVPEESSKIITVDEQIDVNFPHSKLPGKTQNIVYESITGYTPSKDIPFSYNNNTLFFFVFSPIDIQVIDKDGRRVGKDFGTGDILNEIPGAYYTGYSTENEFLTIPNPIDGEYKILTQGTGEGEYAIEVSKISEDETNSGKAIESTAKITGIAEENKQEELSVTVEGTEVKNDSGDTTPPIITGAATTEPDENGWYNQDVTVHFEASDESGIKEITPDVILSTEGINQSVIGEAKDNFDNVASFTVSGINIDKTAPNIHIVSPENNSYPGNSNLPINYSVTDNISSLENVSIKVSLDGKNVTSSNIDLSKLIPGGHELLITATDEAGNKTENKVEFSVEMDPFILEDNVRKYYQAGFIRTKGERNQLLAGIEIIEQDMRFITMIEANPFLKKKTKNFLIEITKWKIEREIDFLIGKINQKKRDYDSTIKTILIRDLEWIKNSL